MTTWENFEIACVGYLNKKFGNRAKFIHMGGADSSVPDIFVETAAGEKYFIEVKFCPAQCGQFVLKPNFETRTFEYSKKNKFPKNFCAEIIMNHMNNFFDEYSNAGTKGLAIDFDDAQKIFSSWIIDFYRSKNVRYIITNNFFIFPVEDFQKHFYTSATYRMKKSGSSEVGKKI